MVYTVPRPQLSNNGMGPEINDLLPKQNSVCSVEAQEICHAKVEKGEIQYGENWGKVFSKQISLSLNLTTEHRLYKFRNEFIKPVFK